VKQTPCTVLSMDVDHLKRVNDTYGHPTGDQYLVDIATMLRASFPDAKLLGRMGGDEFIVIMEGLSPELLDSCVKKLNAAVIQANETSEKIVYGISYGHAFSDEEGVDSIQSALARADARMYDMKQQRHAAEGRA
ncbi:MAG: GGDEF domain-containing protein, partial [Lachnospiraceae bacterium]|nr:GGDEF domain-containing protein [Lachnospiraceae bacterium]